MKTSVIFFWKKSPLIRLLLPFATGILLQWYMQLPASILLLTALISLTAMTGFFFLPFFHRYKLSFISGLCVSFLFISTGALLTHKKDIRHDKQWFGHTYTGSMAVLVTLDEPLVEKTRSLKAVAVVSHIIQGNTFVPATGKIIIYFKKDLPALQGLRYGSQIVFKKPLQEIKNSGNPGAFDYTRYSLFHGITHQVYLQPGEFETAGKSEKKWAAFIYAAREKVLAVLRTHIRSEKELGLAEALLIGYKDDLDKSLVQSYSNAGVVHIIAISGLHLGLIYWLLVKLFQPLRKRKKWKWLPPLLIIAGLWLFSLLAGAQPSVLRSALMFTCIVAGESLTRKTSIYNTLALSAFILLCYNPYWLWDAGFQLSYAAVLSIVIFLRPVYNWFYFKNKAVDMVWKLNAVTLAAQILTTPLSIYHFHQFPNYFLLTNLVAVPLSSLILVGEIVLCLVAFVPPLAALIGKLLTWLIRLMNRYVEHTETLPFALWDGLQVSLGQTILLFIFIAGTSFWLMQQSKAGLKIGLSALLAFAALRSLSSIQAKQQQKIIVYNVPRKSAADLINGRHYFFTGDPSVQEDEFTRSFHLKPSRILHRTIAAAVPDHCTVSGNYISCSGKRILLLDQPASFPGLPGKQVIDLLVISKNPRIYMSDLAKSLAIRQVVFDSSVPAWKVPYWKRDCDSLHIPCHDVAAQGAFVMNLR